MEQIRFERIGETMFHQVLDNGLNVFVFPKPEFQKKYAFFATNYGGMDLRFQLDGTWHDTPAGVAHYLEHKMFDTREGNALQQLTANGASPNAFTSNAITGYYFESTEENLRTLLSFVSVPYFTRESVEKERGIIGQEIGMIEDDPNWTVFVNLLGALYEHHPIRTSVAGTVESISHITEETLYACHKAFYDPANMVLCAAGDLDPQAVCRLAREVLPTQAGPIAEKDYGPEEPSRAARGLVEEHMAVSCPIFQLGCKGDAPVRGEAGLRQELLGDLACEVLLGTSTPLWQSGGICCAHRNGNSPGPLLRHRNHRPHHGGKGRRCHWRRGGPGGRPGRGGGRGRPHRPGGCGSRPVGADQEGCLRQPGTQPQLL